MVTISHENELLGRGILLNQTRLVFFLSESFYLQGGTQSFLNRLGISANTDPFPVAQILKSNHLFSEIKTQLELGFPWEGELEFLARNDESIWLEVTMAPGVVEGRKEVSCSAVDITEKKLIKLSALRQAQFRNALLENAPVAIFEGDESGSCTNVNAFWKSLTSFTLADALGDGWMDAVHPEDRAELNRRWQAFVANKGLFEFEYRYLSPTGKVSTVLSKASFLEDLSRPTILRMEYDLTEKKAFEEKLAEQKAKAELVSRLASLGEMAAGIAHEINNPLTIIMGYTQYLNELIQGSQDQEIDKTYANRVYEKIQHNVERATRIIASMKKLSRSSELDPPKDIPVSMLIENVVSLLVEKIKHEDIQLEVGSLNKDIKISCREIEVGQVLINLFNNACDAVRNRELKLIRISLEEDPRFYRLIVADSGAGIAENLSNKIFEPFFTTKEVGLGTGLGLSISRSIMESHQGRIEYSRNNDFTNFTLYFPKESTV